jgi:prepilin-type N-terminal cleavage/methylation domain-containing protein
MLTASKKEARARGFTLLELLIVIAIIAVLSVILILVLNPAETLKKSRDVQRMSDLNTLKTAIGLILTSSSTPLLSGTALNTLCEGGSGAYTVWYSYSSDSPGAPITATNVNTNFIDSQVTAVNLASVSGTGWIPINFGWLSGGSPISNLPIDPTNTIAALAAPTTTDSVYRYTCDKDDLTFELDAVLESAAYTTDDKKMEKDGGNATGYYEVGTKLTILTGTDY